MILGRTQTRPDLVRVGDQVLFWNLAQEDFVPHEVLQTTKKNVRIAVYERKVAGHVERWIPYDRVLLVPQSVFRREGVPEELVEVLERWQEDQTQYPEGGLYTRRAGVRFEYRGRYWMIAAGSCWQSQFEPFLPVVEKWLQDLGATSIAYDAGELD